jgi:hypothetical protein
VISAFFEVMREAHTRLPRRGVRHRLVLAALVVAILVPLSVAAASGHHMHVVPLPRFHPVTKVVKIKHKQWLVLRSLTISHLGRIRPLVECGGCLREAGPIHTTKFRHGTITYSGVNWLLRGKYAARIIVYRKGTIGRELALRAKLGKHPGLVFERAACLKSSRRTVRCPKRTLTPTAGTPVTAPVTTPTPAPVATPPIGTPSANATASGNAITFSGSVNANGNPIALTVTDTTDGVSHACGSGTGVVQCTWVETGLKYKTAYAYTLTASDTSPYNRAPATATASATTGDAPPINSATLSASANGNSTSVSGSANGNGLAITVTITSSDGQSHSCSGSGVVDCSWGESGLSYSTAYNYTLTASDVSGNGRAPATATASATTGPPPGPESVSVARGTAAPTSKCGGASSCYYIQTTTVGFAGTVTCHITASTYGLAGFVSWTQGANATSNGPDAQENKSVTVQCTDGTNTASGTGNW